MHSKITIFIFLLFNISFSQPIRFKIIDEETKKPIDNVIIFNKSNSDKKILSDVDGYFHFEEKVEVILMKENYLDKTIVLNKSEKIISLESIRTINLKEIVVGKEDINYILDNILANITKGEKNIHIPNFHYKNILKTSNDTLLYINEPMIFKPYDGRYIRENSKIIKKSYMKNFNHKVFGENTLEIFKLKNNEIVLFRNFNFRAMSIGGISEFNDVLQNRTKYQINFTKDENYFKVEFKSKKTNSEGFFIVDNYDFGVYEIKIWNTKKNNYTAVNNYLKKPEKFIYTLIEDLIDFKSTKVNDNYYLEKLHYTSEFILRNSNLRNTKFYSKIIIEPTQIFTLESDKKFDIINFEIK